MTALTNAPPLRSTRALEPHPATSTAPKRSLEAGANLATGRPADAHRRRLSSLPRGWNGTLAILAACSALLAGRIQAAPLVHPAQTAFLTAQQHLEARQSALAAKEFESLAATVPWLRDYALLGQAQAHLALGDSAAGLALLDSIDRAFPGTAASQLASGVRFRARFPAGYRSAARDVPALDAFQSARLPPPDRPAYKVQVFSARLSAGRLAEAEAQLVELLESFPARRETEEALAAWLGRKSRPSARLVLALGRRYLAVDNPRLALQWLDSLPAENNDARSDALALRGRAFNALNRTDEAAAAYTELAAREKGGGESLLLLSRAVAKQGLADSSRHLQDEFASRFPQHAKGQEILWTRAVEWERAGDVERARAYYAQVTKGGGSRAGWARMRSGFALYRAGQYDAAAAELLLVAQKAEGSEREGAWFFAAASHAKAGRLDEARSEWAALARRFPWGFYGHLARARAGLPPPLQAPTPRSLSYDSAIAFLRNPLRLQEELTSADSARVLRSSLAEEIGWKWVISDELDELDRRVADRPDLQLAVIRLLEQSNMWLSAYARARRLLPKVSGDRLTAAPHALLRVFYPMPYADAVRTRLGPHRLLDVAFVHAVMRQESGFNPEIRSHANAIGLLQLIPPTAQAMARKAGIAPFSAEMLVDPTTNIRVGIAFLKDVSRVWKDNPALVLAHYNAGPLPTQRWRRAFETLPIEEAVEDVDFWETRDYVRKVMGNYWTYRLIWPDAARAAGPAPGIAIPPASSAPAASSTPQSAPRASSDGALPASSGGR